MDDSITRNVAQWTANAPRYVETGRRSWSADRITWGECQVPEDEVGALPDVDGCDVVELGCGTGYLGAWLARRGARVVGLDPTHAQLVTAVALRDELGPSFPFARAAGEAVPLRDGSFDLAVSEYGAALWADPHAWIPEAARLLRPGGELVFLTTSLVFALCTPDAEEPAGDRLVRDQRGLHAVEYTGELGVEYHLAHGDWISLLTANGLDVVALKELHPAPGVGDGGYWTVAWGRRWPVEELWRARRR